MAAANAGHTNFARSARIILDLFPDMMRDILAVHHQPTMPINLPPKVVKKKLNADQVKTVNSIPSVGNFSKCDSSLLYILIRNICNSIQPTNGWNKQVYTTDVTVGDDVERIRVFRNSVYGHAESSHLDNVTYNKFIQDASDIVRRFDSCHNGTYPPYHGIGTYYQRLTLIESECMDEEKANEYCEELKKLKMKELHMEVKIHVMRKDLDNVIDDLGKHKVEQKKMKEELVEVQEELVELAGKLKSESSNDKLTSQAHDLTSFVHEHKEHVREHLEWTHLIPRKFKDGSSPEKELAKHRAIFIKGEAGIGKTQYVESLKRKWIKSDDDFELNDEQLLFVNCKQLNQKMMNTAQGHLKKIWNLKTAHEIDVTAREPNIIIIIDGVDELAINENCLRKKYRDDLECKLEEEEKIPGLDTILGILHGFLCRDAKIILFGRKYEINRLANVTEFDGSNVFDKEHPKIMELAPFCDEDVKTLACIILCKEDMSHNGNHMLCTQVYEKIRNVPFRNIPTYATCLIKCFNGYPNKDIGDITKTKLFISTIFNQLQKHTALGQRQHFTFNRMMRNEASVDFSKCLNALAELCLRSLRNSEVTIRTSQDNDDGVNIAFTGESDSDTECDDFISETYTNNFATVIVNRETCEKLDLFYIRDDGCDIIIEPHHLTFFEFLASCYLINHPENWDSMSGIINADRWYNILLFMRGLLADDKFTQDFVKCIFQNQCEQNSACWLREVNTAYSSWIGLDKVRKILPHELLRVINDSDENFPKSIFGYHEVLRNKASPEEWTQKCVQVIVDCSESLHQSIDWKVVEDFGNPLLANDMWYSYTYHPGNSVA